MADESIPSVPPTEDQNAPLPTQTVTSSREVIMPVGSNDKAFQSLDEAWKKAEEAKAKRQSERAEEAEKPAKQAAKEPKAEVKPKPESAPESEEKDARKRLEKMVEAEDIAEVGTPEPEKSEEEKHTIEKLSALSDEEKKVLKQRTQERIRDLANLGRAAEEKAAAAEKARTDLEAKIKELEARKPEGVPDDLKPHLDELAMYRRLHELEGSKEVKEKYDNIVEEAEKSIASTLKGYGLSDNTLKLIEAEGGFADFSRSRKTANIEGEEKSYAEIARQWLNDMTVADAEAIRAKLGEQRNTADAKKRYIDAEKATAKEYFSKQDQQIQGYQEAQKKQAEAYAKQFNDFYTNTTTQTDWMADKEVPADATPEQKKEIADHNRYASSYREILKQTLNAKTPQELLEIALDSVAYHKTRVELARANAKIKALEAKEAKKKAASVTTSRSGSIASPPLTPKPRDDKYQQMNAGDALEAKLEAMARGEA